MSAKEQLEAALKKDVHNIRDAVELYRLIGELTTTALREHGELCAEIARKLILQGYTSSSLGGRAKLAEEEAILRLVRAGLTGLDRPPLDQPYDPFRDETRLFSMSEWRFALLECANDYVQRLSGMNEFTSGKHTFDEWMGAFKRFMSF